MEAALPDLTTRGSRAQARCVQWKAGRQSEVCPGRSRFLAENVFGLWIPQAFCLVSAPRSPSHPIWSQSGGGEGEVLRATEGYSFPRETPTHTRTHIDTPQVTESSPPHTHTAWHTHTVSVQANKKACFTGLPPGHLLKLNDHLLPLVFSLIHTQTWLCLLGSQTHPFL